LNGKNDHKDEDSMRIHLPRTTLFLGFIGNSSGAQEMTHSFLACGKKTDIMEADGNPSWTYPVGSRNSTEHFAR